MTTFKSSAQWLDGLDPEVAAALIATAEVLDLSRQSLYVKMCRYGLMDATAAKCGGHHIVCDRYGG